MNPLLLLGLLSSAQATPPADGRPALGRSDQAGAMLAVPSTWVIAADATEDGGVAETRESQKRLSPVVMLQWGDAQGKTADTIVDERVAKFSTEMAIGSATESSREDFGEGGRRALLDAGMMGVSVPILVAARITDDRYMVAVFTGPPITFTQLDAPELLAEMLTRSIWAGELPPQ